MVKANMLFSFGQKISGKKAGGLLLTLAAALGFWLFIAARSQRAAIEEISNDLVTINDYKTAQIAAWRENHYRDAVLLSLHPFFGGLISEEISRPGSRRAQLNAWLNDRLIQKRDASLAFLTQKGAVVAATSGYSAGVEKDFKEAFALAALKDTTQMTDLYLAADGRPRITVFSPMSASGRSGEKTLCVLVINIDPEAEFYPLLKAAPLFYKTAETLLVRKEGVDVLYLNELEHSKDSALKLKRPLSDKNLPAAKALNEGYSGFFEGVDYRGIKVFSAISPVKGSNWAVITKIDRDMILAHVETRKYLQLALILLAAGLIYGVFYLVLLSRELAGRKRLLESEERYRRLFEAAKDGIILLDFETGKITGVNPFLVEKLGYSKEVFLDKYIWEAGLFKDVASSKEAFVKLKALDYIRYEDLPLETKDGKRMEVEFVSNVYEAGGKKVIQCNLRDITERKRIGAELLASEKNFTAIMEHANDGMMLADIKTGKFLFHNTAIRGMLGYSEEEIKNLGLDDIHPEDSLPYVREQFRKQVRGELTTVEIPVKRKDGSVFYAEVSGTPVTFAGQQALLGVFRDFTERKKAEAALRESNARVRLLLNSTGEAIYGLDLQGNCTFANPACVRMLGYAAPEALLGRNMHKLMHHSYPDGRPMPVEVCKIYKAFRENKGTHIDDEFFWRADGDCFPVEYWSFPQSADGVVHGSVVTFVDITERRRAEAYGEMRQEVLRILNEPEDLHNSIPRVIAALKKGTGLDAVGIRLQDGEDFPYLSQEGFPDAFLRTENTLLARDAGGNVCRDKDGKVRLECACGLVISGHTDPSSPLFTPGGSFWTNDSMPLLDLPPGKDPRHNPRNQCMHHGYASMALVPIRNEKEIIGLIHLDDRRKGRFSLNIVEFAEDIARDIGGALMRRRAEEALQETAAVKSRFASLVSHELRSPLTAILIGVSLVLKDSDYLSANHKTLLELAHDNIDRLARLINNVLDFQKMAAGKMTFDILENDINDVVRTTARSMGLVAKTKGLDLIVEISDGLPRAAFDKDKIIQVLTNLLGNAIAHTEKGIITVHAGHENDMLHVSVRDTGLGIKAGDLAKLFQPFEQLDSGKGRKIGGTGLGLVISKEIILAHNGKIWAESEPGKGAVFHFTLPVTHAGG